MKVVKVRSPFIIEVNEAGAIGSKIELFIYNSGSAIPATPTYTLSKPNPSATQLSTSYNVSNFVKEYIDNVIPGGDEEPDQADVNEWALFRVKRYKLVGSTYTLLDTIDYVGVNGFTNYTDGKQTSTTSLLTPLLNTSINTFYWGSDNNIQNYNFIVDKLSTSILSVRFENLTNTNSVTYNLQNGVAGIFNYTIPISIVINQGNNYVTGCKVTVSLTPTGGTPVVSFFTYAYPIEECKYTPVRCSFINRYGGWQDIMFFKAQTNAISVKGSEYNLLPSAINYNIYKGQSKVFNINGTQTVKLNTGWVDENYNELITDLLLSETILLDNKPAKVKTQSHTFKTQLKDKMINFELDFEYSFDLINNVI